MSFKDVLNNIWWRYILITNFFRSKSLLNTLMYDNTILNQSKFLVWENLLSNNPDSILTCCSNKTILSNQAALNISNHLK